MLTIEQLTKDILEHLGIVIPSEAGHGKTFLAMALVKHFNKHGVPCYIFTPSNIWLKKYGAIDYITVGTKHYNPIHTRRENLALYEGYSRDTIQINLDKKWLFSDNGFLWKRLAENKTTLFNIRYLNGRRIKYFIATALQLMFEQRRDLEDLQHCIIVLEEAQNPFGSYSMNDDISQVLTTVFTQSRSDSAMHYIVIGQRLNDMATKIVERLRPLIGYTIGENSLRKVRSQLPKELRQIPQTLKPRMWLYPSAYHSPIETSLFKSPQFKTEGKPNPLNPNMYDKPQPQEKPRMYFATKRKKPNRLVATLKALWSILFETAKQPHFKHVMKYKNETEEEDLGEEHSLLAEDEDEESESLFW